MPVDEAQLSAAILALRKPSRPVIVRASLWPDSRSDRCKLLIILLLGVTIGATAVLSDFNAAVLMAVVVTVTSKGWGEIVRSLGFAALGLVAALAKTLQNVADGEPLSARVVVLQGIISCIFAVFGGLAADGIGLDSRLGLCAAFVSGILTFGTIRILEHRLRK